MTKYFDTKNGTLENAVLSVYEKKLDPVNKDAVKKKFDDRKDKDIDNDGDVDSTDKFLHKRRKAITKAIEKEGNMFSMALKKARDNGDDEMVVSGKKYKVKDVEDTVKELKMSKNENAYFRVDTMRDALKKVWGDAVKESVEPQKETLEEKTLEDSPNPANQWHMCAKNVVHEKWGKGNTIHTMHADPDKKGMIEWYDVWFHHGIEKRVPTKDLEIVHEEKHHHGSSNGKDDKKDKDKEKEIIKGKKMHKTMTGKPMSDVETKEQTKNGKKSAYMRKNYS